MEKQGDYANGATILIVDDHPVIRYALSRVLNSELDFSVVGIAEDCAECLDKIKALHPDIVILDLQMNDSIGSEAVNKLRKKYPTIKIIIYSAHQDDWLIKEVISIGVEGYVIKTTDLSILITAIRSIIKGEKFLDSAVTSKIIRQIENLDNKQHQKRMLTTREKEILELIAKGLRNKQIATKLFVEVSTVKYHISSIFTKLSVTNRVQAVLVAKQQGMLHE